MSNSIAIKFLPGGAASLDLTSAVTGFQNEVQNALVNILSEAGRDTMFPARGTNLFRTALDGGIFSLRSATHAANFAAVDTLFFTREFSTSVAADKMKEVVLVPSLLGVGSLDVEASFLSISDQRISFPLPISPV